MSSYHPQEQTLAQLPQPTSAEVRHSGRLIEFIIDKMKQSDGVIPFSDYMDYLLYAPGLGYYSAGLSKFGQSGDFVTAPEISPLFGRTLANQCRSIFDQGCEARILEFGAGSGKLCEQILSRLENLENYNILELSADLRARQQEHLKQSLADEIFDRINWLDSLPNNFSGVVLANEVLDAMPVNRLQKNGTWVELGVGVDGEKFVWVDYSDTGEAVRAMQIIENQFGPYENGYTTEVNLNYLPWLKALGESTRHVVALLIDYGYEQGQYYHPERNRGTLLCHYRHRAHEDVLILPGLQDVTASVDFDAVADAAIASGFEVVGLLSQSQFLLANGLLDEAGYNDGNSDTLARLNLAQQIKTLTLPNEMGGKFKVIGLTRNVDIELPVFKGLR